MYLISQIAIGILLGWTLIKIAEDIGQITLKGTIRFLEWYDSK